jgi:two-component sensor histidine kinase
VRHFDWQLHLRMRDGSDRWVQGLGEYVRASDGTILRSRGVAMDITERVKSELHQRLMIAELNHRVKNSLAVVQSLAHQSFSANKSREEALSVFEGRLQALASAHTILTDQKWEQADLKEIAEAALRPHGGPELIRIEGPATSITPKFAVALSMALHELATNSTKYGSLSTRGGHVDLAWALADHRVDIRWTERGGPKVTEPARRGFGTRMIERALAADVGGKVVLAFPPEGVTCVISAPLSSAAGEVN